MIEHRDQVDVPLVEDAPDASVDAIRSLEQCPPTPATRSPDGG
ncbi:hypothetical protein [Halobacterium sp. CBA1126]|nr:hypothetical protein [Halobacterium sp. CBA1126]